MKNIVKNRSASAKALADSKYRQRIVPLRKGKGSYNRKKMGKLSCANY